MEVCWCKIVSLQVMKCKSIIRECVKFCEDAEGDKAIPSEHYDSDGELPEKFIFCAKCLKGESGEVSSPLLCVLSCHLVMHSSMASLKRLSTLGWPSHQMLVLWHCLASEVCAGISNFTSR